MPTPDRGIQKFLYEGKLPDATPLRNGQSWWIGLEGKEFFDEAKKRFINDDEAAKE
jgi:hypothetical protein